MRGIVKWFNTQKGYGFITADNGDEVFVHYSGVAQDGFRNLKEGQSVEFDVTKTERGKQATGVVVVE